MYYYFGERRLNSIQVDFNHPVSAGREIEYVQQALVDGHISGEGPFTKKCHTFLEPELGVRKAPLNGYGLYDFMILVRKNNINGLRIISE